MDLFDSMTVEENISLGPESMFAGRRPWSQLFATPREQADVRERTEHALATCGIQALRKRPTRDLSTGQRRLVELARAVASNFRFLLLDEPSSGLDVGETERLAETLVRYVSSTGIGLLLVEHDMSLVAAVCSYVYVLDFGKLIYSGTTAEILASQVVQAAYLGADFTIDPQASKAGSHA
jgi:ABC-type branched-subunit amino acid transport system ATPase component